MKTTHSIIALVAALLGAATSTAQQAPGVTVRDRRPAPHRQANMPPPNPIAGPTEYLPQAFDVLHYDAWLDLTAAPAKTMSGVCQIRLRWTGDPAAGPFYFHLRDLRVDSVFYNGAPVVANAVGTAASSTYHYELTPPPSAHQGDTAIVRIVYSGEMTDEYGGGTWGGVTSTNGTLFALGVGFQNNYVSTTEHWLPCYDHPADKATFHGWFTVKSGKAVASNGLLVATTPGPDSTLTYEWQHNIACATYLLTFAVDNYQPVVIRDAAPPEPLMVVYARPQDTGATRETFKLLPAMVAGFARRFGPYPFEKVGYVNTPLGAMEHQTMISFPTSLSRSRDTVNSTGAHELAHQWFGDLVSPIDYRHAWLNESFATFCETIWAEELGGYAGYIKAQDAKVNSYISSVTRSEGILPLYDFPRTSPSSNYPQTIYEKGAVVVGMLRFVVGDSLFYLGLRDYLALYAYGNATTEQLRATLEARAGRSLDTFFKQWVYGKGWPVLQVKTSATPIGGGLNSVSVTLQQTQADSLPTFTELPVELGFRDAANNTVYRLVWMNARNATFTLDSIPTYTSVTVNKGPSVRALLRATVSTSGVDNRDINAIDNAASDSTNVDFLVKPNPLSSTGAFSVEVRGTGDCTGILYEMFDSAGRRLLVGRTDNCQFPIPASGFNSGVYVLRFTFRGLRYDTPVMITR